MQKRSRRPLAVQRLENRHLMAGDVALAGDPALAGHPMDINRDDRISALDALAVINQLERNAAEPEALAQEEPAGERLGDVNQDGRVSPLDALQIINYLGLHPEGEDAFAVAKAAGVGPGTGSRFDATFDARDQIEANQLNASEVETLLGRASMATRRNDAIIAVVDRSGRILGVRVEDGVSTSLTSDPSKLSFAIDGAVAKARTAAFFSSNAAPLTSRTVRFISQSTVTQREVESSPRNTDPNYRGPGLWLRLEWADTSLPRWPSRLKSICSPSNIKVEIAKLTPVKTVTSLQTVTTLN